MKFKGKLAISHEQNYADLLVKMIKKVFNKLAQKISL